MTVVSAASFCYFESSSAFGTVAKVPTCTTWVGGCPAAAARHGGADGFAHAMDWRPIVLDGREPALLALRLHERSGVRQNHPQQGDEPVGRLRIRGVSHARGGRPGDARLPSPIFDAATPRHTYGADGSHRARINVPAIVYILVLSACRRLPAASCGAPMHQQAVLPCMLRRDSVW